MSEWPDNDATRVTEAIMALVREHLLPDAKGYPHHYNRVFEGVHRVLTAEDERRNSAKGNRRP
jgi:hypothetical protein